MKYCIVSAQYLPSLGGVERYTYNLARKLKERGNEVIIVAAQKENTSVDEIDDNGIRILRVKSIDFARGRLPLTFNFVAWKKTVEKLEQIKIDRAIIQTRLYTLSLLGMRYFEKGNIPFIVIEHGTNYVDTRKNLIGICIRLYERILLRKVKKVKSDFYTVSESGGEWVKSLGIEPNGALYNTVDNIEIQNCINNSDYEIRKMYNIQEKTIIITFVGRLIEAKGIYKLINAYINLKRDYDVILVLVGNGPEYEKIIDMKVDGVVCTGALKYEDALKVVSQSDIFCLPSDSEGMPTSVMEAIVSKCYVITTARGGAKEIITSEQYGKIIEDNTPELIENAVRDIIANWEHKKNIEDSVYERFMREFTWDKTCNKIEKIEWR